MQRRSLAVSTLFSASLVAACSDDVTHSSEALTEATTDATSSSGSESDTVIDEPGLTTSTGTLEPTTGEPTSSTTAEVTTTAVTTDETTESTTGTTGTTGPDPVTCVDEPSLCGSGTVCDPGSQTCVADCSQGDELCGPGTICMDGMCKPDCSDGEDSCGAGTVCGPDLVCVVDCRSNLLDVCAGQALCNRQTGVCEAVAAVDCAAVPGLCWEDQSCDASGYCRAGTLDLELAYDVQHYDLRLDLLTADQTFSGEVAILLAATVDGTSEVVLDVGAETIVNGTPYLPYEVEAVLDAQDQPLQFEQDSGGALTVQLAAPLAQDETAVVKVRYAGPFNPVTDDNDALYYTGIMQRAGKNGDLYVQTFGWPVYARNWLPSHDHPRDTATFSVDVGIDNDYVVLANGAPVRSGMVDGLQRSAFVLQQPVPTNVMQVIASEFEVVRLGVVKGVPIDAALHAAEVPLAVELLGATVGALTFFDQLMFDYPFSRYAMVSVPSAFGGMEHASIISLADTLMVAGSANARRVAIHELTHHWAGDSAHLGEWQAFWLNESLAEFLTLEALRVLGGQAAYNDYLNTLRTKLFAAPNSYSDDSLHFQVPQDFPGQVTSASFYAPYNKGALVWHMVRQQIGTTKMWQFLADFFLAHRFAPYDTDAALAALNASAGVDFTQFFAEWVHQRGWPRLKTTWNYDAVAQQVQVTVQQVQSPSFGVYTLDGALDLDYVFDDGLANTPPCNVSVAFTGGATEVDAAVSCATAPTGFTISSLPNLLAELAP